MRSWMKSNRYFQVFSTKFEIEKEIKVHQQRPLKALPKRRQTFHRRVIECHKNG